MDGNQSSYFTILDEKGSFKFICYTRRTNGVFCVSLTDAADVWSTENSEDATNKSKQRFALTSTEDFIVKLRSACSRGDVSVAVHDSTAELRVGSAPGITLSRLDGPQATEELKDLLFRMADSLAHLNSTSTSVSPVKNHQRRFADFEPRQRQNCAASVRVKKRLPGASLINPGAKKKLQATGVAFDDADED